jgi:phage head maturation protease
MIKLAAQNSYQTKLQVEGKEIYRFQVTDDRINRNGWKTITAGIDYKEFMNNPVILWGHDDYKFPVGMAVDAFAEGDALFVDVWFHEETPESHTAKVLVDIGVLSMTSITIKVLKKGAAIPITDKERDQYPWWIEVIEVYEKSELLEVSIVNIPANTGSKLKKKINTAIESGVLKSNEWELVKTSLTFNPQYTEKEIPSNKLIVQTKQESNMTFEELQSEHIKLQTSFALAQNDKTTMLEDNKILKSNVADLQSQASAAKTTIDELTASANQYKSDLEKATNQLKTQEKQIVEAQVAADLATLNEFILPAENSQDNNFKLRRDLTHLKLNEATLVDADGNSLYQARIADIKNRKSTNYLKKDIDATEKPVEKTDLSKLDYNDPADHAAISEEAKKLAAAEKITYAEALIQVVNKSGEGK